mgnify:CR=1 FL=1
MGCTFICDGCGKTGEGEQNNMGQWLKPRSWYERSDKDGIQTACSRECILRIAQKTGKTSLILPI